MFVFFTSILILYRNKTVSCSIHIIWNIIKMFMVLKPWRPDQLRERNSRHSQPVFPNTCSHDATLRLQNHPSKLLKLAQKNFSYAALYIGKRFGIATKVCQLEFLYTIFTGSFFEFITSGWFFVKNWNQCTRHLHLHKNNVK